MTNGSQIFNAWIISFIGLAHCRGSAAINMNRVSAIVRRHFMVSKFIYKFAINVYNCPMAFAQIQNDIVAGDEVEPNRIKCSFELTGLSAIAYSDYECIHMSPGPLRTTTQTHVTASDVGELKCHIWTRFTSSGFCSALPMYARHAMCSHSICITCEAVSAWLFRCVAICGVYRITFIKVLILIFASYSVSIYACVCRHTHTRANPM